MLGLIKKDLLLIKQNLKTLLIVIALLIFLIFNESFDIVFALTFICIIMFITTFSYDDYNNFHAYVTSLPNGRKNVVKSKYLTTIIIVLLMSIIGIGITIITSLMNNNLDFNKIFSSVGRCLLSISIFISLMYPVLFKYGAEKGRIVLMTGIFTITAIGILLSKTIDLQFLIYFSNFIDNFYFITALITSLFLLLISYLISKHIYLKKEY